VRLEDLDYALPPERIAQHPAPEREAARLLVLSRAGGAPQHATLRDLPRWLRPGDLLVVNATRVLPARLRGAKASGGRAEALVLGPATGSDRWRALVRARGRLRVGQKLRFGAGGAAFDAEIAALGPAGEVELALPPGLSPYAAGEMPLPPYIRRTAADPADADRYQTVYARVPGSVAAPTAGLHLGEPLLAALAEAGVERAEVVLHVGPGTFRPLRAEDLSRGRLSAEPFAVPEETARAIDRARARGGRVVAVGTTTARALESCAQADGRVRAGAGTTELFLQPGSAFRAVDVLLTNFHLPRSSLLLLVAGFVEAVAPGSGLARTLDAYAEAVREGYRFYSYGDAMLVL
jgi:S-adenosylmethionine:tRNA ribosyltransferase-isomerase